MGKHRRPKQIQNGIKAFLGDKNTLTGRASRAAGWSVGNSMLIRIGTFGISVILARLLGPHAFGTYAVALVALAAMQTFNDLGVSLAIVRWEGEPGGIIPTISTISIAISALTYGACFFGAHAYASAMGSPGATGVLRVLALAILIDGFVNVPSGLLERQFQLRKATIALQAGCWSGIPVTLAMAWAGCGAMSLAVGQVFGALVTVILLVVFAPQSLRLGFDSVKARALLRFGLPLAGANLVAFAVTSIDQFVVGRMLGATELGFYLLASNMASWPLNMFSRPLRGVAPAVFSRLRTDGAALRGTFLSTASLLCALALPACLTIGASAGPLTEIVYGGQWVPAARPLIWLALLTAMQIMFELAYDYLVVLARTRFLLLLQLAWLVALIPALAVGTKAYGISGTAMAETAVALLVVLPCYLSGLRRTGIVVTDLGKRLLVPIGAGLLSGCAAAGAARLVSSDFAAIATSGMTTIVIVAFVGRRLRAGLAAFRGRQAERLGAE